MIFFFFSFELIFHFTDNLCTKMSFLVSASLLQKRDQNVISRIYLSVNSLCVFPNNKLNDAHFLH